MLGTELGAVNKAVNVAYSLAFWELTFQDWDGQHVSQHRDEQDNFAGECYGKIEQDHQAVAGWMRGLWKSGHLSSILEEEKVLSRKI